MDFTLNPLIGLLKKALIIFNKVDLSLDVNASFDEVVYVIKNNGEKNIENFIIKEYKNKNDLEIPDSLFDEFEERYFADDYDQWLLGENFLNHFKSFRCKLSNDLNFNPTPSESLKLYCNFFEKSILNVLNKSMISINEYCKNLEIIEEIKFRNVFIDNQIFLDEIKIMECKKLEYKSRLKITKYLSNLVELINLMHDFSRYISLNNNLETMKNVFRSEQKKKKLKEILLNSKNSFSFENVLFIKNILEKSYDELNIIPNPLLYFTQTKIRKNSDITIKIKILNSVFFDTRHNKKNNITIKDYSKKIELKYEEFSLFKKWSIFINSEYRNKIKEKKMTVRRTKWNKIEITKFIEIQEITENSSNLYDSFYRDI